MSWQDNRRRERRWYKRYKEVCDEVKSISNTAGPSSPVRASAFVDMVYRMLERSRSHKNKRIAISAYKSMELAIRDTGLYGIRIVAREETGPMPGTAVGDSFSIGIGQEREVRVESVVLVPYDKDPF